MPAQAYARATADGVLERYGQYAWDNEKGTVPLARRIGLHGLDASEVISHVIERQLRASGAGLHSDDSYQFHHIKANGTEGIYVISDPADGSPSHKALIPYGMFRGYQTYRLLLKQQGAYGLANMGLSKDPNSAAGKRDAQIGAYERVHKEGKHRPSSYKDFGVPNGILP